MEQDLTVPGTFPAENPGFRAESSKVHPLESQSKALLIITAAECGAEQVLKQEPGLGAAICQGEAAEMKKEEVFNLTLET